MYSVVCLYQSMQCIHCEVTSLVQNVQFLVTFVYAANVDTLREELWSELNTLAGSVSSPWLLLGDFNVTLFAAEIVFNGIVVPHDTSELVQLVQDIDVADFLFSGFYLTWCNKQEAEARQYCKLDRALVNSQWLDQFLNSEAVFLAPGSSDHSPCVVKFLNPTHPRKHMFKYLKMWASDSRFMDVVATAWSTEVRGTPMYILVQKMKAVKQSLKTLHRN